MMVRNGWIYWPLEVEVSPAAMHHVEAAIRDYLKYEASGKAAPELFSLANQIRACLHHIVEEERAAPQLTDEELLL